MENMLQKKALFIILPISLLFLFACGPKAIIPTAKLDTLQHHVANGNKLLKTGKIDAALREFERGKELDPKHSSAYVGLGLGYGFKGEFEKGFKNLEYANIYAVGDDQKATVHIGYMRLYLISRETTPKKWLERVKNAYVKAVKIAPAWPDPYFYMGIAYKMSYMFSQAIRQFSKVLELDKGFVEETEKEYSIIQKIQRAMPISNIGKKIALSNKITRADAAAIFMKELEIDELFAKHPPKELKIPNNIRPVTDIEGHALKADINAIIKYGIKELQPFPNHTFKPYHTITRAEYATMIEDILIKLTGDDKLATAFIGKESPFPDLRNDLSYFNAAMVCTSRGLMEIKDCQTGEFDPHGFVSGADALLSIRTLKTQLQK